jgi:hypothetical protein
MNGIPASAPLNVNVAVLNVDRTLNTPATPAVNVNSAVVGAEYRRLHKLGLCSSIGEPPLVLVPDECIGDAFHRVITADAQVAANQLGAHPHPQAPPWAQALDNSLQDLRQEVRRGMNHLQAQFDNQRRHKMNRRASNLLISVFFFNFFFYFLYFVNLFLFPIPVLFFAVLFASVYDLLLFFLFLCYFLFVFFLTFSLLVFLKLVLKTSFLILTLSIYCLYSINQALADLNLPVVPLNKVNAGFTDAPPSPNNAPPNGIIPNEVAAILNAPAPLPGVDVIPPLAVRFPLHMSDHLTLAEIGFLSRWYNDSFGILPGDLHSAQVLKLQKWMQGR